MIPNADSGWLKIFEQKGWIYLSLALFCGVLRYLLGERVLPSLASFNWLPDASLLGAILFGIFALGSSIHRVSSWSTDWIGDWRLRKAVLSRLDSLSDVEHRILSYLVQANQQSFNYRIDDGDVQQLVQKGLLRMAGGHQNVLAIPFFVPDFVWRELKRRADEFSSASPPDERPWVKSWMAY